MHHCILKMYANFQQALTAEAATYINNALVDFENKFAPVPPPEDNTKRLYFLIDIITLGVSVVAGPFFNSCKCSPSLDNSVNRI